VQDAFGQWLEQRAVAGRILEDHQGLHETDSSQFSAISRSMGCFSTTSSMSRISVRDRVTEAPVSALRRQRKTVLKSLFLSQPIRAGECVVTIT